MTEEVRAGNGFFLGAGCAHRYVFVELIPVRFHQLELHAWGSLGLGRVANGRRLGTGHKEERSDGCR